MHDKLGLYFYSEIIFRRPLVDLQLNQELIPRSQIIQFNLTAVL